MAGLGDWHPREGDVLDDRWEIIKKLGAGAFGAVYEVRCRRSGKSGACKVEHKMAQVHILKWEVLVMKQLTQAKARRSTEFLDCGRSPNGDYNYLCMTMVGANLEKLRDPLPGKRFSLRTCLHIGVETLEGMRELHDSGYLHRDVKPENFAIGREPDTRRVFVLDLGMVRQWRRSDGQAHTPRRQAAFRGNLKFASINALRQKEQSRADDLCAWFYQLIELTTGDLPWPQRVEGTVWEQLEKYANIKEQLHRNPMGERSLLNQNTPREYLELFNHINGLRYDSNPDYDFLKTTLVQTMQRKNYGDHDRLDWETGGQFFAQTQMVGPDVRF